MKLTLSATTGYLVLNLSKNARARLHVVHQVIARAFLGPQPHGIEVDHVNARKTDNRLANLEYVTPQENDRRATVMGLKASGDRNGSRTKPQCFKRGERHYAARLSNLDVKKIKRLVRGGRSQTSVACEFGISPTHVCKIMSGNARKAG